MLKTVYFTLERTKYMKYYNHKVITLNFLLCMYSSHVPGNSVCYCCRVKICMAESEKQQIMELAWQSYIRSPTLIGFNADICNFNIHSNLLYKLSVIVMES